MRKTARRIPCPICEICDANQSTNLFVANHKAPLLSAGNRHFRSPPPTAAWPQDMLAPRDHAATIQPLHTAT